MPEVTNLCLIYLFDVRFEVSTAITMETRHTLFCDVEVISFSSAEVRRRFGRPFLFVSCWLLVRHNLQP
jgi:hypothetical protein